MFLLVPLADQCHRQQPGAESRVNVLEEVQEGVAQGSFASSNHETQVFVGNIGGHALQEDHEGPIRANHSSAHLHISRNVHIVHICKSQSVQYAVKVCAAEPVTRTLVLSVHCDLARSLEIFGHLKWSLNSASP